MAATGQLAPLKDQVAALSAGLAQVRGVQQRAGAPLASWGLAQGAGPPGGRLATAAAARPTARPAAAPSAQAQAEGAALQQQLAAARAELAAEREARVLAASEVAAAQAARADAQARAERLSSENTSLVQRLVALKAGEAEKLNEINRMHEEMVRRCWAALCCWDWDWGWA